MQLEHIGRKPRKVFISARAFSGNRIVDIESVDLIHNLALHLLHLISEKSGKIVVQPKKSAIFQKRYADGSIFHSNTFMGRMPCSNLIRLLSIRATA